MIDRFMERLAFSSDLGRQMRFIAGPRQVGKTTLAKRWLGNTRCSEFYYNWDRRDVRQRYRIDSSFLGSDLLKGARSSPTWVCYDEVHKIPQWKNLLKDHFDTFEDKVRFIVTGSARLDFFRRSGDSLAGRYFLFRMLPIGLAELAGQTFDNLVPVGNAAEWIEKRIQTAKATPEQLEALLNNSGFPEPLSQQTQKFLRPWTEQYHDTLIREDLRDLTRISGLENIARVLDLLPTRIGSPLSVNALRENVEVAHATMVNYLKAMELTYLIFTLKPYHRKLHKAVKKEGKVYFYNWTLPVDAAKAFENYVAVELKFLTELWNAYGIGPFDLMYIRTKDGKETDFLILKKNEPWLMVECKLKDGSIDSHHFIHQQALKNIPLIQLCFSSKILQNPAAGVYRISAVTLFG